VLKVKYLATTLTNQNYMHEKSNTTFEECMIAFGQDFLCQPKDKKRNIWEYNVACFIWYETWPIKLKVEQ